MSPGKTAFDETATDAVARLVNSAPDAVSAHLFVAIECGRLGAGGARHSLVNVRRAILGRGALRASSRDVVEGIPTLVVRIPNRYLSSEHAVLHREGNRFLLEDLGSRNGTRLNGTPVRGRAALSEGDILEVGHTVLLYRAAMATPPLAEADLDSARASETAALTTLDAALERSVRRLEGIARSMVPVVVLGETGTGKELIARAVHRLSGRKGPFVAVNCGALPATLLEAQLFGHVRGAFSGASSDAQGFLRSADGGTLFLDEVGDLPNASQVAFLRALQEGEVVPVGAVRPVPVDLRVVAATHRRLDELVSAGQFRSDLYARLAGFVFSLPPLRARRQDVGVILAALVGDRSLRCTAEAGRALVRYDWPLNVRELGHALEVAAALAGHEPIDLAHLPAEVARAASAVPLGADPIQEKLAASLARHRGNVSEVAREFGTARMQVQRWMRRFGLDRESFLR